MEISWQDIVLSFLFIFMFAISGIPAARQGDTRKAVIAVVTCIAILALLLTD